MTEKDMEIQNLRRENEKLQRENDVLKEMHYCDIAEIIYLRRQNEFLVEIVNGEE